MATKKIPKKENIIFNNAIDAVLDEIASIQAEVKEKFSMRDEALIEDILYTLKENIGNLYQ